MNRRNLTIVAALALALLTIQSFAQDNSKDTKKSGDTKKTTTKDTKDGKQASSDAVLNKLQKERDNNPIIDPARPKTDPDAANTPDAIKGTSPLAKRKKVKLRREGQFILTRRGRLVKAKGGTTPYTFVFDGDTGSLNEPPMFLMPCLLLEDMEKIAKAQGDSAVFVVSGQVFVYKGANYLLPTLMKLAQSKGNLQR